MKKVIITAVVAFAGILMTQSCGKAVKCVSILSEVSQASIDFDADPTANCIKYKKTMQDFIDNCGADDATQKAEFQAIIDSLPC